MPENLESKQYNLEEAENEAESIKKKVESGNAEDYKEAEKKQKKNIFRYYGVLIPTNGQNF